MKAGSLDQSFGDIEKIECPDPTRYGGFEEVGQIQGSVDRASSSLTGRYAADIASALLEIARRRCAADVQYHFGECTDPRIFNAFTKAIILEDAYLPSWSVDDLGALESGENSPVNENVDLSIGTIYEVLQLTYAERGKDVALNEVVDVVICDMMTCGECEDESWGCEKIYALTGAFPASPGPVPDIYYSLNKGSTWAEDEINSLLGSQTADALACLGDYLFVVSNDSGGLHWKLRATVDAGTALDWTAVTTGFTPTKDPNDVWSVGTGAFVVGDGGYVYYTTDPTTGVSVLDAGVAVIDNLNAVHAISDEFAVAVGDNDAIVWTKNRTGWQVAEGDTGTNANLTAIWIKDEKEWWVTTDTGLLYYTLDGGVTWTAKTLPGTVSVLRDIQFATDSVAYVCGNASDVGKAWRTYDGGYSWIGLPEGTGNLPTARDFNALAACEDDVNFNVLVGEGSVINDGILVVGED
jgi:photosystem II stability/assembly factor-like uncharacterized protein